MKIISDATAKNWQRLNSDSADRLKKRANKRLSEKEIFPEEYLTDKRNKLLLKNIKKIVMELNLSKEEVIYSLSVNLLEKAGIYSKKHVKKTLREYSDIRKNSELAEMNLPETEKDILGFIYQMMLTEGEKNVMGSYYTPHNVVGKIINNLDFSNGETFFDPCCGSGAYLLSLNAEPEQIYAMDNDSVAVLVAKVNLLLKFADTEFEPHIFCGDFLKDNIGNKKFNYIATNPPWGAMMECGKRDSFVEFFVKSFGLLEKGGQMNFLLPESVLNVKKHRVLREFILDNCRLEKVTLFDKLFSGVLTKYVDIQVRNSPKEDEYIFAENGVENQVSLKSIELTQNKIFNNISETDEVIIRKIKEQGKFYLNNSIWALGIVTGNNNRLLAESEKDGCEAIYTGKEIEKYSLKSPKKFIKFDAEKFQQVAKEEYYRAEEKLIYKFISKKPVFAYDNQKSLILNSANLLIPKIQGMSVKTVMAFLNSEIFEYLYKVLFGEVKILKGNLEEIPFPEISDKDDKEITSLVDEILKEKNKVADLENKIYSIFGLQEQETYIKSRINK